MEEDEPDLEEGEEKSWEGFIKDESIFPSSCIVFKQQDNYLINRVKNLKQEQIVGTHYNLADMKRRIVKYKQANESEIAEPSVQAFYREQEIQVFEKDASLNKNMVFDSIKIYIERVEKPNNFLHNDIENETKRRILVQNDIIQ